MWPTKHRNTHTHKRIDARASLHSPHTHTHTLHSIQYNETFKFQGTFWLVAFFIFEGFVHFTAIYKQYIALVMWNKTWTILLFTNQQRSKEGEKIDGIFVFVCKWAESIHLLSLNFILPQVLKLHSLAVRPFLICSLTHTHTRSLFICLCRSYLCGWIAFFLV